MTRLSLVGLVGLASLLLVPVRARAQAAVPPDDPFAGSAEPARTDGPGAVTSAPADASDADATPAPADAADTTTAEPARADAAPEPASATAGTAVLTGPAAPAPSAVVVANGGGGVDTGIVVGVLVGAIAAVGLGIAIGVLASESEGVAPARPGSLGVVMALEGRF